MITAALLACALEVSPVTLDAIARVESGGNPWALHVNRLTGPQPHAASAADAAGIAKRYVDAGYRVDIGLLQVDSENLSQLGLTVETALDPCSNIRAGGRILADDYAAAVRVFGEGQTALMVALSAYNTGNWSAGFRNGYVARYYHRQVVPAFAGGAIRRAVTRQSPDPYSATTEVDFTRSTTNG